MSKEMSTVTNKEPLMHISKRDGIETWKSWLIRIIAVLLSLVVCAGVIVALTGLNPIEVYHEWSSMHGAWYQWHRQKCPYTLQ